MIILQLVFALILTRLIFKNIKQLDDENFRQKYGTLYVACATNRGKWPLIFITIFFIRRVIVALCVGAFVKNAIA